MNKMKKTMKKAQSLIEYGLILALVAVIAVTVLGKFGRTMTDSAERTNKTVTSAADNAAENYCKSINGIYDSATGLCKTENNSNNN